MTILELQSLKEIEEILHLFFFGLLKACLSTCPPNSNDVFRIGRSVGILFFHSGQPIGSVDMCLQIKHVQFLEFLDFKDN